MLKLDFDEKTHSYSVENTPVPGLSHILQTVGLVKSYKGVDPYYANRGIAVHRANELWLNSDLDESTLDPACKPFFEAFKGHITEKGFQPKLVEMPLFSETEGFACRIDYYGRQDGYNVLIDAKCTKAHDRGADYQLCGQAYALVENGYPVDRMEILELHEDGTVEVFEYPVDLTVWSAVMMLYRRKMSLRGKP